MRQITGHLTLSHIVATVREDRDIRRFGRTSPSLPPERTRHEDHDGKDLQAPEDHGNGAHPALEVSQPGIVGGRTDCSESRAHVVDAGDDRAERGDEIEARQQQRERQRHDPSRATSVPSGRSQQGNVSEPSPASSSNLCATDVLVCRQVCWVLGASSRCDHPSAGQRKANRH
jgi:hypothetical protein